MLKGALVTCYSLAPTRVNSLDEGLRKERLWIQDCFLNLSRGQPFRFPQVSTDKACVLYLATLPHKTKRLEAEST
jgi:hypothetical protein